MKKGKVGDTGQIVSLPEAVLRLGDKVNIEGDKQRQADLLARVLCDVEPAKFQNW